MGEDDKLMKLLMEFDSFMEDARKEDITESHLFKICVGAFDFGKELVFATDEDSLNQIMVLFAELSGRKAEIKQIMEGVRLSLEALGKMHGAAARASKILIVALAIDIAESTSDAILASIMLGAAGGQSKALEVAEQLKGLLDQEEGGDA